MIAAAIAILAVWVALMLILAVLIERYAPERDEDEELLGHRRLP